MELGLVEIATQKETERNPLAKFSLEQKREAAKIGMSASLLLTAGSALFLRNKTAKAVHTIAGLRLWDSHFGTLLCIQKLKISIRKRIKNLWRISFNLNL